MSENYTLVTEHFVKGLCNHRLRFGTGDSQIGQVDGLTIHCFRPHRTFGLIRWARNDYGTILWNLYICETQDNGRVTEIPGVYPGADLLFRSRGTKSTRRLLARLTKLEKRLGGDLSVLPASYWRQYHSAEICNFTPPKVSPYLERRHA